MYLYCNNKLIQRIQSKDYTEEMPRWSYDVTGEEDMEIVDEEEVLDLHGCSTYEVEENLEIDETLRPRRSRRFCS